MRHLDLDLFGLDQILRRNAKACGRHLLDLICSRGFRSIQRRVFSAFTGIAASAQPVHRQRKRAMRLRAQRAKRHRLRTETPQNGLLGLDLLEWNLLPRHEFEQVADGNRLPAVAQTFIIGVIRSIGGLDERVHPTHNFWRGCMALAGFAKPVKPGIGKRGCRRSVCGGMHAHVIGEHVIQALTAEIRGRILEVFGTGRILETDDFK